MRKINRLAIAVLIAVAAPAGTVLATQPVYVAQSPEDCINTFIVRMLITASNAGQAVGDFDDSRLMMVRRGTPEHCRVDMLQVARDGSVEDRKTMQCLFRNPLEEGY